MKVRVSSSESTLYNIQCCSTRCLPHRLFLEGKKKKNNQIRLEPAELKRPDPLVHLVFDSSHFFLNILVFLSLKKRRLEKNFFFFSFSSFSPPQLMSLGIYFSRISALYAQVGKRRRKKKKEEGAYTRRQNNNGSHLWQGLITVHGIHDNRISNSVWNKLKMSTTYPVRN